MKNYLSISVLFFGVLLLSTNESSAQWMQISIPCSSEITCFAVNGENLFAGTSADGVFLSTNDGTNWTAIDSGLTISNITTLAISGTNLFAGGYGGVNLSTDNGTSWMAVNTGLTDSDYVSAVIVSDTNLIVGTSKQGIDMDGYTYYYGSVFRSTNNGQSWIMTRNGLRGFLSFITKDNDAGGINIFAGTIAMSYAVYSYSVFLSTDNGTQWTNNNLSNIAACCFVVRDTNLFAGGNGGVFLSTNDGTSWTAVNSGMNSYVEALIVSGKNLFAGTAACYGSVFLSTNNGTSWDMVNTGLTINSSVTALAVSGTNLFAGTNGCGVWRRPLSEIIPPIQYDSLVDVFPLSIGNEWVYNYHFDSYDEIARSYKVSGTVLFQVIGKSFASDSIIWKMQRTNDLNCNRNGMLSRDTSISTFNIIEINNGNHRVCSSEFPFSRVPFDSVLINRYTYVDTSYHWSFETDKDRRRYTYTFKRDIGALSYFASDIYTNLDYFDENYLLINSHITGIVTDGEINHIKEFRLDQNYPNPFNPTTTFSFYLPSRSVVSLKVFDIIGREVSTLVNGELSAGVHTQQWNAVNMSSGVYFYRLQAGSFIETKKLVLLR